MIFKDLTQRLRFVFSLAQFPGEGNGLAAVRAALAQAGVKTEHGDIGPSTPALLRADAKQTMGAILDMPPYERDAILAVHSRSWESKRLACDNLRHYFRPLLANLLDDHALAGKLVTRHYIAQRERGSGWSRDDLAEHHRIGMDRLNRAIAAIDAHAKELEHAAMQTLQAKLDEVALHA